MRRMREQLGVVTEEKTPLEHIAVSPRFQSDLARVWQQYLDLQQSLAADNFQDAQKFLVELESTVATVDDKPLAGRAKEAWTSEKASLAKLIDDLKNSQDIKAMRVQFLPLSEVIGALAKTFGFGEPGPIYELHCPMAFQGKGAIWYQDGDQVRNPYYGATMLTCADRVEELKELSVESRELRDSRSGHSH
jgi:Cu(I)/Ag(I) efflux system membrane fusion protein